MADKDPKTGQFIRGNKASPGRPARHTEASVLEKMWQGDKPDRIVKSVDKMIKLAEGGDVQAFKAVIAYYAGLPVQKLQLSVGESAQLAELIELLKARGLSASDVFAAMIGELKAADQATVAPALLELDNDHDE